LQRIFDEKDRIIRNIVRRRYPIRHFELRKIVVTDKRIMSAGAFERRIKNLIKMNALQYVLVGSMKFYSFDHSFPPEAGKLILMKEGLNSSDMNIVKMKKLFPKLPLNEKAEFAARCVLSAWANIFDILKYHADHNPKVITKLRLLTQYQQKLREIDDIIGKDKDRNILELFVDARCRPNPNQLSDGEFDTFLEMRYLASKLPNS